MSRPVPVGDYGEHFDPELPHHRAWLLAVLEQLVANEPQALEEGGTLRRLWTARQEGASAPAPPSPRPPAAAGVVGDEHRTSGDTTDAAALIRALASHGIMASHVIAHDPLGEADLVNGTTIGGTARFWPLQPSELPLRGPAATDGAGW